MSETNSRHFLYWFDILRLLVRFELNNRTNEDKTAYYNHLYSCIFVRHNKMSLSLYSTIL